MKATDLVNIDTANEEIARLAKQLGRTPPKFVPNIFDANAKIEELGAELAKRKTVPVADAPITPKPTTTTVVPPVKTAKQPEKELYGLRRSIAAATGQRPITSPAPKRELHGLEAAVAANLKVQKKD